MNILDTQIISYAFKGNYGESINQQSIASVTAKEFLLIQGSERTKANYYVPLPKNYKMLLESEIGLPKRDHRFPKRSTDQILLEFGQDYPAIIEFGNLAIAEIINLKAKPLFNLSIQFLEKEKRKLLTDRFDFLLDQDINCIPLNGATVDLGLNLFHKFLLRHNTKENIKNTINDVFILATAVNSSSILVTKDSLLNRFASEYYNGDLKVNNDSLVIDFGREKSFEKRQSKESKGYINRGWKVRTSNYQGDW
jgi:hypothetical protein